MSDFDPCAWWGHKWQRQPAESARLPPAYALEKCAWCGDTRSVLNRGI